MWPYHPELLETPVPRYTSYPTAADFGPIETSSLTHAIAGAQGDVSLYLHIPFCEKICYYCGCNTAAAGKRARRDSYLRALHREIETVASLLPGTSKVRRIAFGGGSPNAIEPSDFSDLVEALQTQLHCSDAEYSVELDPRSMTREWGKVLRDVGVTRASMGVQTFAAHCQKAIGREQSDAMICRTIDWLRDAGVSSINFDLMYGLPEQTEQDLSDTLEYAGLLGADRIALFGYAHVPHIVPRQRMIPDQHLPGRDTRFTMAASGYDFLTSNGYQPVGFDHFAKPADPLAIAASQGTLRRNFQGFTDDPSPALIGLGSSAISAFPHLLAQNEKNSGRYRMQAIAGQLTASHGIVRSPEDRLRADVIERLLCAGSVRLSPCLLRQVQDNLAPFIERGLATLNALQLTITPDGLPYARTIAALFDPYRAQTVRQFSAAI
ncbi:MAG: oxygen-independent coproporphyrinogen III oxidase [Pseudomonadota bacterium]